MSDEARRDDFWLRDALAPGKGCLSIEDLGLYLETKGDTAWRAAVNSHLLECAHCQTEYRLMQEFTSDTVQHDEAESVRAVVEELDRRSTQIFQRRPQPARARRSWWTELLRQRWITPAAAALAGVLLVAGIGLQLRQSGAPALNTGGAGSDVLRSNALTVTAPVGDVGKVPDVVTWQSVSGAAKYQVRLLEVDGNALWQAESTQASAALPADVRGRIVPAKTLLWQVTALDGAGARIADSEKVRFRLTPDIH